jgi:hypothetical protein
MLAVPALPSLLPLLEVGSLTVFCSLLLVILLRSDDRRQAVPERWHQDAGGHHRSGDRT